VHTTDLCSATPFPDALMTSRSYARAAALAAALLGLSVPTAVAATTSTTTTPTTTTATTPTPTSTTPAGTTGGGGLAPSGPTSSTGTPAVTPTPAGAPVQAEGDGFSLTTTAVGTYRRALAFTGSVPAADRGAQLEIQRQSGTGAWHEVASTTVASDGSFALTWRPNVSGVTSFRATLAAPAGTASAASAAPAPTSPPLAVTIYRDSIATIYGPGFFGHKTACGEKLKPTTLGVASRTLKCGTLVSIDYDGQSVTVPVIDRGPFANHATWDLTSATASALGDEETETVGAAVL
jgi:rare lipoprotein A